MTRRWLPPGAIELAANTVGRPEGLVAIGGQLRVDSLIAAYRHGLFPWFQAGDPVLWWCPETRAALYPAEFHRSRSLRQRERRGDFGLTVDRDFAAVVEACAHCRREDSWITPQMRDAYVALHRAGWAHSVELWGESGLQGGLYGVAIGGCFFAESMFSRTTDASKLALSELCRRLEAWDFALVDCQLPSAHLHSLGVRDMPRALFLGELAAGIHREVQWGTPAERGGGAQRSTGDCAPKKRPNNPSISTPCSAASGNSCPNPATLKYHSSLPPSPLR